VGRGSRANDIAHYLCRTGIVIVIALWATMPFMARELIPLIEPAAGKEEEEAVG